MKTSDFDYYLPEALIAQEPAARRDDSQLLVLSRMSGAIRHSRFHAIRGFLRAGDRLVFNNTKVIPARLVCVIKGMNIPVELLFTKKISDTAWQAIGMPARRLKQGTTLSPVNNPAVTLRIDRVLDDGTRIVSIVNGTADPLGTLLQRHGQIPLPPYIKRSVQESDAQTYQTVYAERPGAVAAPTAGLHFTRELLEQLQGSDITLSYLTLHIGIGTFRPVKVEDPALHSMHEEEYELTGQTVEEIEETKKNKGRVIAVGTTAVRVLEHCALENGSLRHGKGTTRLMILPGYAFKIVDGLITNFHLPRSTLLMLVSAFGGRENILNAYHEAVEKRYRFFSYGDAMVII